MPHRIMPGDSVLSRYRAMVDEGTLERDAAQEDIAARLDQLKEDLGSSRLASKSSALGWLMAKRAKSKDAIKGLYIHGSVGRGKTMLMDFFVRACPEKKKLRVHFHEFMGDVHDRINAHRRALKEGKVKGDDPIPPVAASIAQEAKVLCFDEFTVTDIADAMVLSRLFEALFSHGVVLVATSNVVPDNLYKDGLNRALFLPFVDLLKSKVDVVSLDAERDYRLGRLAQTPLYLTPLDDGAKQQMNAIWRDLTAGANSGATHVSMPGRKVPVPMAALDCARFSFADLCEQPLGARDYLAIARTFHTIMIDDVPVLIDGKRNEAKRFINLIDTLYDNHNKLVISAAAEPTELYQATRGTEAFEFERTASRLIEMRSDDWVRAASVN